LKKVIIVGAGISGLSAGIYALQSGFDVTIYESHTIPGGASTSWRRNGYFFEGGMHWLTGSSPKTPLNRLWREVGALNNDVKITNADPFQVVELEGKQACLYRDVDRFRKHLLELSKEDEKAINRMCSDIKKFSAMTMPVMDIKGVKVKNKSKMSLSSLFKMLPAFPRMSYYAKQTAKEYASQFKSPIIRMMLENLIGPDYASTGMIFTLATFASGDGGYPEGGSLAMANHMAAYFKKLGGIIQYSTPVKKVAVKNNTAVGVVVGEETVLADAVIVTLDTLVAIDKMFDSPIKEPWADAMRENTKPMLDTFIGVGVEADLTGLPERIQIVPDRPFECGGISQTVLGILNYAGFKGYAPEGCTAVTSIIVGDSYDFWKQCKENGTYEAEKEKLAKSFIDILAAQYPQTAGKVVTWDVATPLTYERYLGSYKGSWMTLMGKGKMGDRYPSKPESVNNVYFAGQRLMSPGGLPAALDTGRKAVQTLCKETDTVFQGNL